MKWYRSYVKDRTTTFALARQNNREFVYDPGHCEPIYIEQYNYWSLLEQATEDFVIVEWDIAVSFEKRKLFEGYCRASPDKVHVVPYRLYARPVRSPAYSQYIWWPEVREGDPFCFYFGFGFTYLPIKLVREYVQDAKDGMVVTTNYDKQHKLTGESATDGTFNWWHATKKNMEPVPVHWDCEPVHMHHEFESMLEQR